MTSEVADYEEEHDPEPVPDALQLRQEAFEAEQRSAITSTDVAKILGLTRYGSPLSVFLRKKGREPSRPQSLPAWLGLRLEGVVAELCTQATGLRLRNDERFYVHPEHTWLGCHVDRRVIGDPRIVVELKTRNSARGWGADGTDEVPAAIWCQVQQQAFVLGAREVLVAALFSNNSYRTYRLKPDPAFERDILPTLHDFWFDNVEADQPPLATEHDGEYLRSLEGGRSGEIKAATPEQEALVALYRLARYNAAQAAVALEVAKNRIIAIIGEADGIRGTFGVIMFKRNKPGKKVHWEEIAGVYRRVAEALFDIVAPGDDDAVVGQLGLLQAQMDTAEGLYTEIKEGARPFLPDLVEEP